MVTLKFEFTLDMHGGVHAPIARIWLDSNRDMTLQSDEELVVSFDADSLKFTAERDVETDSANGMPFRVKYFATVGATWKLKVTLGEKTVYESSDPVLHEFSGVTGNINTRKKGGDQ